MVGKLLFAKFVGHDVVRAEIVYAPLTGEVANALGITVDKQVRFVPDGSTKFSTRSLPLGERKAFEAGKLASLDGTCTRLRLDRATFDAPLETTLNPLEPA